MGNRERIGGFTVLEMIITVVVMLLFVGLLFQVYMFGTSQRQAIILRAAANDLAVTNLRKIASKSSPLLASLACGPSNDLTASPPGAGTNIAFTPETPPYSPLPSSTTQTLRAFFPRGCNASYPIKILSTVRYNSETVTRATYVQ